MTCCAHQSRMFPYAPPPNVCRYTLISTARSVGSSPLHRRWALLLNYRRNPLQRVGILTSALRLHAPLMQARARNPDEFYFGMIKSKTKVGPVPCCDSVTARHSLRTQMNTRLRALPPSVR